MQTEEWLKIGDMAMVRKDGLDFAENDDQSKLLLASRLQDAADFLRGEVHKSKRGNLSWWKNKADKNFCQPLENCDCYKGSKGTIAEGYGDF